MSNKPRSSTAEVLLEVFGWGALIPQQEHQGPPALWCVVGFGQWEEPAEDGGWDGQRLGYLLPHQHPSLPLNPLHTPGAMPAACVPGPQMPHLVLLASLDSVPVYVVSFLKALQLFNLIYRWDSAFLLDLLITLWPFSLRMSSFQDTFFTHQPGRIMLWQVLSFAALSNLINSLGKTLRNC